MPGNSKVEVKVTFAPMDFSTAHMKLQVNVWNPSYGQILGKLHCRYTLIQYWSKLSCFSSKDNSHKSLRIRTCIVLLIVGVRLSVSWLLTLRTLMEFHFAKCWQFVVKICSLYCLIPFLVVNFSFWSPSSTCLHLSVLSLELPSQDLQKGISKLNNILQVYIWIKLNVSIIFQLFYRFRLIVTSSIHAS